MKKFIAFVLMFVCGLGLVSCNIQSPPPAPTLTNEIYTGKITEITDTTITIICDGEKNKEMDFLITKLADVDEIKVGNEVTVETAYMPGAEEPYPAIRIIKKADNPSE